MEIPLTMKSQESRMKHTAQKNDEKRVQERRRNLLYLIQDFLRQDGLIETLEILQKEAQLSKEIKLCDNIDLETILTHYSDYYWTKFNKLPKFCKKIDITTNSMDNLRTKKEKNKPKKKSEDKKIDKELTVENNEIFELCVTKIPTKPYDLKSIENLYDIDLIEKKLRSINDLYPANSELREIAEIMTKEIILTNLNVHWSDIHGLEECKKLLHETMIYPMKYPELFDGKFSSWQGILLYGPPGTGKTMLARAVATECKWTFFNITASSLISKWRGESEKYIRVLCNLAIHQAPSIIFIDEIDWIMSENAESSGKLCEPARRFRAELLAQLDGLISMESHRVVLLAATNSPWNLDAALLRRLDKHILVDLPDDRVRREILEDYTESHLHTLEEFNRVVFDSVHYSGSDLKQVCKEAWMMQVRRYIESREKDKNYIQPPKLINSISSLQMALQIIYPTAQNLADKYHEWKNKMKKIP